MSKSLGNSGWAFLPPILTKGLEIVIGPSPTICVGGVPLVADQRPSKSTLKKVNSSPEWAQAISYPPRNISSSCCSNASQEAGIDFQTLDSRCWPGGRCSPSSLNLSLPLRTLECSSHRVSWCRLPRRAGDWLMGEISKRCKRE